MKDIRTNLPLQGAGRPARPFLAMSGPARARARALAARAEALRALALFTEARPSWVGAL